MTPIDWDKLEDDDVVNVSEVCINVLKIIPKPPKVVRRFNWQFALFWILYGAAIYGMVKLALWRNAL